MRKTSVALGPVLELLAAVVLAVTAAACVDHEAESVGCVEVALIQSARSLFRNPEPATEEQKVHFESFREAMMKASRNTKELKELRWRVLRTFPAIPMERELQEKNPNPGCSNIGKRFPILVSRNQSLLDAYAEYACGDGRDYFVTDPARSLNAELAPLEGGCINVQRRWRTIKMTFASNASHGQFLHRDCPESCQQEDFWHQLPAQVLDQDMLVLPSIREPPQMGYQHSLIDFLPQAWTVLELLRNSSTKLVIHTSLQSQLLASLGFPPEQILEVPLTDERPAALLCAKSGRSLHLWRVGSGDSEPLPKHPYQDRRIDGDLWHRLIDIQVGPEISDAIAQYNGFVAEPFAPRLVLFLQRCTDRRILQNEQAALAAIRSALIKSNRTEELVSMCAGRADFLEQAWKVRQARLIVGAHGGAMANMVLARSDAGIIELVGDAAAQKGLEGAIQMSGSCCIQLGACTRGLWPPYKSNFYGGLGAAFPFYRASWKPNSRSRRRGFTSSSCARTCMVSRTLVSLPRLTRTSSPSSGRWLRRSSGMSCQRGRSRTSRQEGCSGAFSRTLTWPRGGGKSIRKRFARAWAFLRTTRRRSFLGVGLPASERVLDVLDCYVAAELKENSGRADECARVDVRAVMDGKFIDVSQGVKRGTHTNKSGFVRTFTTSTVLYDFSRDCVLTGYEMLLLHGFPRDFVIPPEIPETEVRKVAGEGMSIPSLAAVIWCLYLTRQFPE